MIARVGAVQIWPEWNVHTDPIIVTAVFTSASSNTSAAPLPPSSSSVRFIVRPPTSAMRRPTPVEPVNETMSTSRLSTSASPVAGRRAGDDVDDAFGEADLVHDPHELDHRERVLRRGPHDHRVAHRQRGPELARHVDDREVVRRDARDDADRRAAHDRTHQPARRERGRRHLLRRERDDVVRLDRERAYVSKRVHAVGTCICLPTVAVQPVSAITSGSRSSKRALIASAVFCSSSARYSGFVCDHESNASRAARAASCAWATDASGRVVDDLLGRGVDDVVAAVGPVDPLPADQQLARRHGAEV